MTTFNRTRSFLVLSGQGHDNAIINDDWAQAEGIMDTEEKLQASFAKIFCTCGYEGDTHRVTYRSHDGAYNNIFPNDPDTNVTRTYYARLHHTCPECGAEAQYRMYDNQHIPMQILDHITLFDNRVRPDIENRSPKIVLAVGISSYFYNKKAGKIGYSNMKVRFTHNTESKSTYAVRIRNGRSIVRNISYGAFTDWAYNALQMATANNVDRRPIEEWTRLVAEASVQWIDVDDLRATSHWMNGRITHMTNAMLFASLPQLQVLPFRNYMSMDPDTRKQIRKTPVRAKEMWELVAGSSTKKVRKLIKNEEMLADFKWISQVIQDQNNLWKLFETPYGEIGGHQVFPEYGGDGYTRNRFKEAYDFFMPLHKDEAHFVQCLMKIKQEQRVQPLANHRMPVVQFNNEVYVEEVFAPDAPAPYREEYVFNLRHAVGVVTDTLSLYRQCKERAEDQDHSYELEYNNDFKELHDRVSRDIGRLNNPKWMIPYSEAEYETYNRVVDGWTFRVAYHTHELVDTGNEMNICVGGYGERAAMKEVGIVLGFNPEGQLKVCIELSPDNKMRQAKLHRNERPKTEVANIVATWANEANVFWKDDWDMQAATEAQGFHKRITWADANPEVVQYREKRYGRYATPNVNPWAAPPAVQVQQAPLNPVGVLEQVEEDEEADDDFQFDFLEDDDIDEDDLMDEDEEDVVFAGVGDDDEDLF